MNFFSMMLSWYCEPIKIQWLRMAWLILEGKDETSYIAFWHIIIGCWCCWSSSSSCLKSLIDKRLWLGSIFESSVFMEAIIRLLSWTFIALSIVDTGVGAKFDSFTDSGIQYVRIDEPPGNVSWLEQITTIFNEIYL